MTVEAERRRPRRWIRIGVALAVAGSAILEARSQAESTTLVVLVRHAERAPDPGDDPPISEIGKARARALAETLTPANVGAVVTTSRRRTTETAQPLLDARGLVPEIVSVDSGLAAQVANVTAAVRRHRGAVVLVVGHSNTVPAIVHALGGPPLSDLCDTSFSTMFVMELPGDAASGTERAPRLIRTHYGAPDPPGADDCVAPATVGGR